LVATTTQAYVYASDDPVDRNDPSGDITVGVCGSAVGTLSFFGIAAGRGVTICLVHTTLEQADEWGVTETTFTSVQRGLSAGLGLAAEFQVTSAQHLVGLAGTFTLYSASGKVGIGLTASLFYGSVHSGTRVVGADIGVAEGVGGGGFLAHTFTKVQVAHTLWTKGLLEAAWATLGGPAAMTTAVINKTLALARGKAAATATSTSLATSRSTCGH
jgi:hypothetical protein